MATGHRNRTVGQAGEYLVASELSRRGFVTTTFTGNVPDYDIVATDEQFRSVLVQVKTSSGTSWQFDLRRFADVTMKGDKQVIGSRISLARDIICVLVALGKYGEDRFYVMRWSQLRDTIIDGHLEYLSRHKGVRPKKADSFHCGLKEGDLARFRDNWAAIEDGFGM